MNKDLLIQISVRLDEEKDFDKFISLTKSVAREHFNYFGNNNIHKQFSDKITTVYSIEDKYRILNEVNNLIAELMSLK